MPPRCRSGETVVFQAIGDNEVHLSGHLLEEGGDDSDSEARQPASSRPFISAQYYEQLERGLGSVGRFSLAGYQPARCGNTHATR